MNELMDILMDIDDSIDWEHEEKLIDERILDSFAILSLVSEMEAAFDIDIDVTQLVPENMNSVQAMWEMIQRLQEK